MCGILGGWQSDKNFDEPLLKSSLSKLKRRGPNDSDFVLFKTGGNSQLALGHTRLSIIDLSSA